ncbi:MAG: DUF4129 domain-containing protein [Muribaculaceae bacterium]|nr:DUF4129 domain-containing protein [Muribaculaceae bacterium]
MPHSDTIVINEQALDQIRQSGDYDYTRDLLQESDKLVDQPIKMPDTPSLNPHGIPSWAVYLFLAVVLLLLLYFLYRTGALGRMWDSIKDLFHKKKGEKDDDDDEEEMPEEEKTVNADTDIHSLKPEEITDGIDEAMAAGNYRLAVRLIYLTTLRDLHERGTVQWKHDKTPEDYAREAGLPSFTRLTLRFMMVRYGDYEATREICEVMRSLKSETLAAVPVTTRKEGEA